MNKKILSLILALVMVFAMLPAPALAVQSGFTAAPSDSGSLTAANPVLPIGTTGPMALTAGGSKPTQVTQTGIADSPLIQSATGDGLTKFESQNSTVRAQIEEFARYAADEKVTFIVVTEDAPQLEKFSAGDIAARTASVNAYKGRQEVTLNAVKARTSRILGSDMKLGFTYTIGTTGFSVETSYGNKASLEAIEGVRSVYVAPTFSLPRDMGQQKLSPQTGNSAAMIGADVLNESGYTGRGMRIAILDTGILESHPSFQAMDESHLEDPITREGVEEIWDTLHAAGMTNMLNVSYKSNKIPYAFNYVNGTFDVDNTYAGHDHGTHVAGISAANAVEDTTVKGMAPDAQLIVMQVFDAYNGADWSTIMAALEDCIRLEVDAANLSLGAAAGFTDPADDMLKTMDLFLESDIQVLIASGNDTHNGFMNLYGSDMSLISNPDIGLTGTPATYSSALAVASANNNGDTMLYFTVDGAEYGFVDTATTAGTSFIQNFRSETLEYVMVPGVGAGADYAGLDVTGKVAVISRGSSTFLEKQAAAQAHGAIAAIIYNDQPGLFRMNIRDDNDSIPCVCVTNAAGKALADAAVKTLTVCDADTKQFILETMMSDFSSWGVTPDLKLKPEITGVGGNIYSATHPSISGSYYGYMSGTSMATPQITGAMAIVLQYLEETFPELTGAQQRVAAANILMSTADPILHTNGLAYSPRNQGAGLADLVGATTALSYLSNPAASESRPKVEFGDDDDKDGVYRFTFELTNMADRERTFALSSSLTTETIVSDRFIGNQPYALEAEVAFGTESEDSILRYDFNDDGTITTADARIVLQFAAGTRDIAADNVHYGYLDINADGTVDAADARVITDYCAGLETAADLTDTVSTPVDQVTVPAGGTARISGKIVLTDADKAYLDRFPNGIYVEGFVYAAEVGLDPENAAAARLNMPVMGFYGDWSDADVFDRVVEGTNSLYPTTLMADHSDIGRNPYFANGRSGDAYSYLSYANPLYAMVFGQLRNARKIAFSVTDNETGDVYHTLEGSYLIKTHYSTSAGAIIPTIVEASYGELWDGKTPDGSNLPDGTAVTYKLDAWLDDGDDHPDDTLSFQLTIDNTAPQILNASDLQENLVVEGGRTYLNLDILENEKLAAVIFMTADGHTMGKYELENVPGETLSYKFDITGYGNAFTIIAGDYACNETEVEAFLDLGAQNNVRPQPQKLSKDRLYGCETYLGANIEVGWFSADRTDFSDWKNETFDSDLRYYAAEFVNGYVIGQNANSGHLELITPSGTYWSTQVLTENVGRIGDPGVWVFYDLALDHSGTLAASFGIDSGTDATDSLLGVGWLYGGDQDNNGKDDGYNALFQVKFTNSGTVTVQPIGRLTGMADGCDMLTMAITTEGDIYGIASDGTLYTIGKTLEYDDETGASMVRCTRIAATSFVYEQGFSGLNVIQSMGYDHNTGTMYWYAHSQIPDGVYYDHLNMTYIVDPKTGACTEVGTYGPGGQTCLFVPNDLQSDLFVMGAEPTGLQIQPQTMELIEGQTKRLSVKWNPWNAEPTEVTWSSGDASIATIDEYGFLTAVSAGTVTISASAEVTAGVRTATAVVHVVPSEDALYGFIAVNHADSGNSSVWAAYSDKDPETIRVLGHSSSLWSGGTYYNGYVYTTLATMFETDGVMYQGTELYRSPVTKGETPAQTVIGAPERIGFVENMEITALAFDYTSGRMYCVENKFVGGLGIIDLETAAVDMLGHPNGDLYGGVYMPGLCVTADGTIVISDAVENLYTIDPDTLTTRKIHQGSGDAYSAFYEAMAYDHDTGSIYWNACDGAGSSPLYLVRMPQNEGEQATVFDMGDVSGKLGSQQTVLFAIPEQEPETQHIPVESIEILNGETLSGLQGGSLKLDVATVPARPTLQAKTWTSSNEDVVTVDRYGTLTYKGTGTATVTVSITNKDEAAHGGPFTDSIEITVLESAGAFVAFLAHDEGTSYYDFWLRGQDYDLRHTTVGESMISVYSLRSGAYYDGFFYAYNSKGQFMRINADVPSDYKVLGTPNLDVSKYQVTAMAMDYISGTMYGLTLPSDFNPADWTSETHPGALVTIDLDTGLLTTVAELDFATPVFALACDAKGTLYAAGGSHDPFSSAATIYTVDKTTGALTPYTTIGGGVHTGSNYYGDIQYNTQMAYDFSTDRLYIYATSDDHIFSRSDGMFLVQLGDEPTSSYLDGISLDMRSSGSVTKYGDVYLGLLAFIPEEDEIPTAPVNGIILNKTVGRIPVAGTTQLHVTIRPSNAADPSVTWSSSEEDVATVDENGLVTGVAPGKAVITATSSQTGIYSSCAITVVELTGPQSTAYTVSANRDSLIKFNPALPAQTAEVVTTMSGGSNIRAICAGEGCIYYVLDSSWNYYLYRYDLLTQQSTLLGQIYCYSEPSGLSYDADSGMLYATAGFYIFQFKLSDLDPGNFNYYINCVMDSIPCTLVGIASIDGAVYTIGNDIYSAIPRLMRYSDKYLSDRTVILEDFDLSLVDGATDFSYDASTDLFYITDAGHNIYTLDREGNVESVDILGEGLDMYGLAIFPAAE